MQEPSLSGSNQLPLPIDKSAIQKTSQVLSFWNTMPQLMHRFYLFPNRIINRKEPLSLAAAIHCWLFFFLNFSVTSAKLINQLQKPSGTEQRGRFIFKRFYSEYLALSKIACKKNKDIKEPIIIKGGRKEICIRKIMIVHYQI